MATGSCHMRCKKILYWTNKNQLALQLASSAQLPTPGQALASVIASLDLHSC